MAHSCWTNRWPTTPGNYLFIGRTAESPRLTKMLVEVGEAGRGDSKHLLYIGGGHILYSQEWEGVWQPFTLQPPDVESLLNPPEQVRSTLKFMGFRPALPSEVGGEWIETIGPDGKPLVIRCVRER